MLPNIGIKCLDLEYHAFPRGKRRDELGRPIGEMRGEGSLNSFPTPFTQFLACKQALQGAPVGVGGGVWKEGDLTTTSLEFEYLL